MPNHVVCDEMGRESLKEPNFYKKTCCFKADIWVCIIFPIVIIHIYFAVQYILNVRIMNMNVAAPQNSHLIPSSRKFSHFRLKTLYVIKYKVATILQ